MRIFFCSTKEKYVGGAETYLDNTINILESKKIETYIYHFRKRERMNFELFFENLKIFNPDIIHFNKRISFTPKQIQLIRNLHVPIVLTIHDYFCVPFPINFKNKLKRIFYRYHPYIDYYIIPSKTYYNKLKAKNISNIFYIPHFVKLQNWCPKEKRNFGKNILFVGRLEYQKGIFFLLDMFKELSSKHEDIVLYIIGSGSCKTKLEKAIENLNLNLKVKLVGFKTQQELSKYYSEATLLILPSLKFELFGLVGLEAQASKLPVIASNLEGVKEWCIDSSTGLTFQSNDKADLIRQIEQILSNKKLYKLIQTKAYHHVTNNYSKEIAIRKLINFYHNISNEI